MEIQYELDSTTVYGTLVKPAGNGPFAAAVMVAGSGPTDRDWNSPLLPGTNGSARLIADALAEAGIASIRYDKRLSGPHAGENLQALLGKISMESHANELIGAIHTLAGQPDVRNDRIFGIGNSEGTLHLLNYQLSNPAIPLAGLVLIGPPGRSVGAVAHAQLAEQVAGLPDGDAMLALYDRSIERFLAGEPVTPDPSLTQTMQLVLQSLTNPLNLPFARELWMADAAALIGKVTIPVLVVIGKKDIQIDWQADGALLQKAALGHDNITFSFPENANHILKHEPRPRSDLTAPEVTASYNAPDARLDPDALAEILKWLTSLKS